MFNYLSSLSLPSSNLFALCDCGEHVPVVRSGWRGYIYLLLPVCETQSEQSASGALRYSDQPVGVWRAHCRQALPHPAPPLQAPPWQTLALHHLSSARTSMARWETLSHPLSPSSMFLHSHRGHHSSTSTTWIMLVPQNAACWWPLPSWMAVLRLGRCMAPGSLFLRHQCTRSPSIPLSLSDNVYKTTNGL